MKILCLQLGALLMAWSSETSASSLPFPKEQAPREQFTEYFRAETALIEDRCLSDISSLQDWTARRESLRVQLREMLGLEPLPPRTELRPVITGKLEQEGFTVEKLRFEAMPQLYVTANLYIPANLAGQAPAILYACGHARMFTNGVSSGNKSWYQHHGQWFARNGYVCLIIDSLQLGEIEGLHHGTYREGQWWWNSRGYTPAGVEAWFGIRALDYLCTRPEVDKERIGMTGRSGGGSYTWTVAALDDRVKVAAPVAGVTDLRNQVVDGAVDGHCDCMFFLNSHRWDFPQLAALIAPRPLLIANSDKDTIFPLDGVVRLHSQTRRIYQLYGATNKLGLLITEGPHADTQDLQLPVFRWFNRFLKGADPLIESAAKKFVEPLKLRVFDELPADQVNTRIQERFVPMAAVSAGGDSSSTVPNRADVLEKLQKQVFAGWPEEPFTFEPELFAEGKSGTLQYRGYTFSSQPGIELKLFVVGPRRPARQANIILTVLDAQTWTNSAARGLWQEGSGPEFPKGLRQQVENDKSVLAFFAPRAVEPSLWVTNKAKFTSLRRRHMLLGQTLDGMRVWDIRCAIQAIRPMPRQGNATIELRARGEMGVNACYAALFEPSVKQLELEALPATHIQGPDYLNVLKIWDIPQMLETLRGKVEVRMVKSSDRF